MPTRESQSSRIQTGNAAWISIPDSDSESSIDPSFSDRTLLRQSQSISLARFHLFESVSEMRTPLPERFPRLTLFAIAAALLAFALTAEFDYLRGAGYYWP